MRSRFSPLRTGPAGAAIVAAALTWSAGCSPPRPTYTPVTPPPVQGAAAPEPVDPLALMLAEPRADDLAELVQSLGIEFHSWGYDGPPSRIRLWIEVQDDRVPGPPEIAAEGTFDLIGPDARILFVLLPPMAEGDTPSAIFGTDIWGQKQTIRSTMPPLWHGEPDPRELTVQPTAGPVSIEEAMGLLLLSVASDRVNETPDDPKPTPLDRISLELRVSILPDTVP